MNLYVLDASVIVHHLFDTLYHGVALHSDTLLITADEQYFRKAKDISNITLLADYRPVKRRELKN